ncbi:MAG: PIN domain-containing protein [Acidimicrobiales bacterium]
MAANPLSSMTGARPRRLTTIVSVVFIEVLRLITVLVGALVGLAAGAGLHTAAGRSLGAGIGVLVGYVAGGIGGRFVDRGVRHAERSLVDVPAPELLAGALLGGLGFLVGLVVCIPLFVFFRRDFDYPIAAGVGWVVGALGVKLGTANGRRLAAAARLTRQLAPDQQAPPGSVLVDTSAVMDRAFLVLGRSGLLGREILVPQPVADEIATLSQGPDPVSSRRARRGLEAIAALGEAGVSVTVVDGEYPEATMTEEKVLQLASRLGVRLFTCSSEVARHRASIDVPIVDLRSLVAELSPDHIPGEHLAVDLVKPGRQGRQAVGYLPDGDMVVVNEAEHLIGTDGVPVVVLSTRPTAQGILVFARLEPGPS